MRAIPASLLVIALGLGGTATAGNKVDWTPFLETPADRAKAAAATPPAQPAASPAPKATKASKPARTKPSRSADAKPKAKRPAARGGRH